MAADVEHEIFVAHGSAYATDVSLVLLDHDHRRGFFGEAIGGREPLGPAPMTKISISSGSGAELGEACSGTCDIGGDSEAQERLCDDRSRVVLRRTLLR